MSQDQAQHEHGPSSSALDPADSEDQNDFMNMEDFFQRDFDLKKDRIEGFLKQAGLREGQHVLELGCGFAPLLDFYLDSVGPTGSVTLSDPEARLADRLAPRLAGRNARFLAGRAEDLAASQSAGSPGGGDGYDLAVMVNVYVHLKDPDAALKTVRGLLKGGGAGRLVIIDYVYGTLNIFVSASASEYLKTVQSRLAKMFRPEASSTTGLCITRLAANGFALRHNETFILQDRLRSPLGDFYFEFLSGMLGCDDGEGKMSDEELQDLRQRGMPAMRDEDPDAVLFSDAHVMLAADPQ